MTTLMNQIEALDLALSIALEIIEKKNTGGTEVRGGTGKEGVDKKYISLLIAVPDFFVFWL
jgi:hypothetical protein